MSNTAAKVRVSIGQLRRPSWLQAIGVSALLLAAACADSQSPTAPTRQVAGSAPSAAAPAPSGVVAVAASSQQTGTASFQLVDTGGGIFGFAAGMQGGVTGRLVTLAGDIVGMNFEPGECVPGVDNTLGFPNRCVGFGNGPGQFIRARPGGVNFTTCDCTVGGVGAGDSVILKISYPRATPPQFPFGFTKFTFQHGTGALAKLRGQGTLDFASDPQVSFKYHFAGRL